MKDFMPLDQIEDWDRRLARQDAFWRCAVLDRPVVAMQWPKEPPAHPWPIDPPYACIRERWLDPQRAAAWAVASVRNTEYGGDALPHAWPNLGPEVFSAFFGQELEYTETTSWAKPCLFDWADAERLRFSEDNPYWQALLTMTDALIDAGKDLFYTGLTDLHPGGDAIAAFRDPLELNTDLLLHPDAVRALLDRVQETFFDVYDFFHNRLRGAKQAVCSWPGIVSSLRWHVPSNDFSCMVSKEMFDAFFLPGIAEECRRMEASIYHLDGPQALRHLDSLLEIPELNAIQWVYGAGNGRASDWMPVYQRCQAAGKGAQLFIEPDELDAVTAHLRPEGVWLGVAVRNREEAAAVLRRVARWK
ncbi:MAG TPA: hypothetical protein ENN65_00130 [Candidatus Hydrogenedentes bacterium]|nr:hypothetical protein [Candidatus Hydrogenedentota bacterium]